MHIILKPRVTPQYFQSIGSSKSASVDSILLVRCHKNLEAYTRAGSHLSFLNKQIEDLISQRLTSELSLLFWTRTNCADPSLFKTASPVEEPEPDGPGPASHAKPTPVAMAVGQTNIAPLPPPSSVITVQGQEQDMKTGTELGCMSTIPAGSQMELVPENTVASDSDLVRDQWNTESGKPKRVRGQRKPKSDEPKPKKKLGRPKGSTNEKILEEQARRIREAAAAKENPSEHIPGHFADADTGPLPDIIRPPPPLIPKPNLGIPVPPTKDDITDKAEEKRRKVSYE